MSNAVDLSFTLLTRREQCLASFYFSLSRAMISLDKLGYLNKLVDPFKIWTKSRKKVMFSINIINRINIINPHSKGPIKIIVSITSFENHAGIIKRCLTCRQERYSTSKIGTNISK